MPRIGIDAHVVTGKPQGSRTWLINIVGRAAARHPEATYVVYSGDPEVCARTISGPNIEHRRLPRVPAAVRLLAVWPWLVLRDRLDTLLTNYIAPPLVPGHRQVVVVHDILFETHPEFFPWRMRWRNRILTRLSAQRARLVLTISDYSRDRIAEIYRVPPARIAQIRCGTEPPPDAGTPPLADGRPYLLMVGRLEPRKNLGLVLDAFARLPAGAARLIVVGKGDGERPGTLDRLARTPDAIHVAAIDDRGLSGLYAGAAALVFPSRGEGWGIPVLDSLARGTPVIASNRTAIPEAGGPAAHYFDPEAPDRVERLAALMRAAIDGTLPFDAAAARAHAARHDWDGPAAAFVALMRRIVPARDPAPAREDAPSRANVRTQVPGSG
ncbi:glycosyltransferase family 1 protein [Methylobacterium sp. NEAU 140]|uniref:glycosyltransferase family 4 protein n=1 Tax=Methylobacterium sp. NEAU 140 TaxID=3064945 RepID=UPI0027340CA2|nr:glycosyltransferase family 1 protein [Methylobacterium sp. NEAU 140]MDP4021769.1 glycosyltransferase family 1 protein [Methylobacterium sp. NEAU 140]